MPTPSAMRARFLAGLLVAALAVPVSLSAQESGAIRGLVTDAQTGEPISGAQVSIRGSGIGTITNNDGRYILPSVPSGRVELRVEYIGYSPQARTITVAAGGTATEDFEMGITAIELEALVATGYAEQTRREVSSAISTIPATEIQNQVVASLDAALQGKAAGVQVVQNAGNPGNAMTVRVRGSASISASNQPLYVVDGVPIYREDFSQANFYTGGQELSAITGLNPDEVESIDILKDAAAASIYGSRASNGVVMITTKRGQASEGTPRVTVSTSVGWQEASKRLDMLNAAEYIEFFTAAMANDGFTQGEIDDVLSFVEPGVDTDWQEEVLGTALVTNTQVAVNGGTDRFQYYLSGSYFDQEGIVLGSAYDRASGRANLDFQASDRLNFAASLALSQEDADRVVADNSIISPIANAIANEPVVPVYDPDGGFADDASYSNPVAVGELDAMEARTLRSFGSLTANYGLTSWLRASGRAGFDFLQLREYEYNSPLVDKTYAAGVNGVAQIGNAQARKYLLEGFLTANQYFGAHELTLTAGASTELNDTENSFARAEGLPAIDLQWPGSAARPVTVDGAFVEHNLVSFFGRANYVMNDRYILNASLRADGSSRFGENDRYGYFPSAALAWVVSRESFMSGLDFVSDLKLRGSWGVTGNESIGEFGYLGLFGTSHYGDEAGLAFANLENQDLRWERTKEWNIGADGSFLGDRLGVVVELYNKTTDDLLLNRPVPSTTGFTNVLLNVGGIENRGWELTLRTVNLRPDRRGGLEWTTELNVAHNENEVTALADDAAFTVGFVNRVAVGQPLGYFYMARFEGVDPETGNALFSDLDENGIRVGQTTDPTAEDRTFVGSPHPDYYGGLRNTLSFGALNLSAFLEFSEGAEIYNGIREYADDGGWFFDNKFGDVMDYWRQPGDVTDTPRPTYWYGDSGSLYTSSRFVEDGSYVRLADITLGVRLPEAVNGLLRTQNGRLYVSGRNLKTWTDYSGYNPDVNSFGASASAALGTDFYAYPLARTITVGFEGTW